MPYYRTCPYCGANLDPGERCDCAGAVRAMRNWAENLVAQLTAEERVKLWEEIDRIESDRMQDVPASVSSTDGDGVERIETPVSIPSVAETSGFVNGLERGKT